MINSDSMTGNGKTAKKPGCLYGFIILFILWICGGWYLWQSVLDAPVNDGPPVRFEIIPGSDEHTSPDDVEDAGQNE